MNEDFYLIRKRIRAKASDKILYAVLAIITFAILFACSFYTMSDFRTRAFDQDIFYVIGRNWAEGNIPYVTAWDSKDPIVFFFNMIGYMITKNETGILILEAMIFVLTVWCCFYFSCKYCNKKESFLFTICFLINYVIINSGGNQVGDYSLPLSAVSIFFTYHWSKALENGNISHPWKYSIVYGMFFASCLLSRLTNAMTLCASMLVIFCVIAYHKMWKNLFHNTLAFILGGCIVAVPFAAYFYCHNALYEMCYASLLYNIEYAIHSSHSTSFSLSSIIYFIFNNNCLISIFVYALATYMCHGKKTVAYVWLTIALICIAYIFKSYARATYTISFLPIMFVALIELSSLYRKSDKKTYLYSIYCIYFISIVGIANHVRVSIKQSNDTSDRLEANHQIKMINNIPQEDSFILYNCTPYIYATLNIHPYYPYWVCQDWAIEHGMTLRSKVRNCYKEGDVKWIVACDYEHSNIKDILLSKYYIYKEDKRNKLTLFKLRKHTDKHKCQYR